MSKMIDIYNQIKKQDNKKNTLLLFKSGIFFIFIDDDAKLINSYINLKLTNLNNDIVKCGFPCSHLDKYLNLLKNIPYKIQIIDLSENTCYEPLQYQTNDRVINLIQKIASVETEALSIKEAFDLLDTLKNEACSIVNKT